MTVGKGMAGVPAGCGGVGAGSSWAGRARKKGAETRAAKNTAGTSGLGGGERRAEFPEKQAGTGNAGV